MQLKDMGPQAPQLLKIQTEVYTDDSAEWIYIKF